MSESGELFGQVVGLFTGRPEMLWDGKDASAIAKKAVSGPCVVKVSGLEGDMQADLSVHGGPEQAIHHYAADHLDYWQGELPELREVLVPGCFGENIATTGLDEHNLCIGDVLSFGSAKVQVSQGRQPCWKLNQHLGRDDFAFLFRMTLKTGWYYRVLESGITEVGDFMHVIERPAPKWSIHTVLSARFSNHLENDIAQQLAELTCLSPEWRGYFSKLTRAA